LTPLRTIAANCAWLSVPACGRRLGLAGLADAPVYSRQHISKVSHASASKRFEHHQPQNHQDAAVADNGE
jgi:hypothetical protein